MERTLDDFVKWFAEDLKVVRYPIIGELYSDGIYGKYQVIINVSDEYYLGYSIQLAQLYKTYCWFPMGECEKDMGLVSMFGALWTLYQAYELNKSVLLHCHAGANRSPTTQAAFHYMMTGEHSEIIKGGRIISRDNMLLFNMGKHLPERAVMELWLQSCKYAFDNPDKFIGGMYDWTLRKAGMSKYSVRADGTTA